MNYTLFPTTIECYDDIEEPCFKLEAIDEFCASIEIETAVSKDSWPELSKAIQDSLNMMYPADNV
jgi:hypothetical protein